ncbi:hypothetical protein [Kitasatospora sp. MY 5-36]|uniref:hypothetical protein n=1 Tax=Kitasatospora sp. MY 5-36 TaxID=1678027 RepID=UPI00131D2F17|nr:hypothetical protein [Kitasatospora sp. MY 5-36]
MIYSCRHHGEILARDFGGLHLLRLRDDADREHHACGAMLDHRPATQIVEEDFFRRWLITPRPQGEHWTWVDRLRANVQERSTNPAWRAEAPEIAGHLDAALIVAEAAPPGRHTLAQLDTLLRHLAAAECEDLRTRPGRVFLPPGGEPWRRGRRTVATTAPVRTSPLVLDLPRILPGTPAWIRPAPYLADVLGLAAAAARTRPHDYPLPALTLDIAADLLKDLTADLPNTPPDTAIRAVLYPLPAWALNALRDVTAVLRTAAEDETNPRPALRATLELLGEELDYPSPAEMAADLESLLVVLELDGPAVREAAADMTLGRRRKHHRTALDEVHAQWARLGVSL